MARSDREKKRSGPQPCSSESRICQAKAARAANNIDAARERPGEALVRARHAQVSPYIRDALYDRAHLTLLTNGDPHEAKHGDHRTRQPPPFATTRKRCGATVELWLLPGDVPE